MQENLINLDPKDVPIDRIKDYAEQLIDRAVFLSSTNKTAVSHDLHKIFILISTLEEKLKNQNFLYRLSTMVISGEQNTMPDYELKSKQNDLKILKQLCNLVADREDMKESSKMEFFKWLGARVSLEGLNLKIESNTKADKSTYVNLKQKLNTAFKSSTFKDYVNISYEYLTDMRYVVPTSLLLVSVLDKQTFVALGGLHFFCSLGSIGLKTYLDAPVKSIEKNIANHLSRDMKKTSQSPFLLKAPTNRQIQMPEIPQEPSSACVLQ